MLYSRAFAYLKEGGYTNKPYLENTISSLLKLKEPGVVLLLLQGISDISSDDELICECKKNIKKIKNKEQKGINKDADIYNYISLASKKTYLGLVSKDDNYTELIQLGKIYSTDSKLPIQFHARAGRLFSQNHRELSFKIASYMADIQRDDGGWINPQSNMSDLGSCIWTSLEIILLLQDVDANHFNKIISKGHDYIKSRFLLNNPTSSILTSKGSWDELSVGHKEESMFTGGTLKYLESLIQTKNFKSKDIRNHIDWLRSIRLNNSLYPRNVKGKQIPDPYVSVRALRVLDRYYRQDFN